MLTCSIFYEELHNLIFFCGWNYLPFLYQGSGESITSSTGRIATPKWLSGCTSQFEAGDYFWVINPSMPDDDVNAVSIEFTQIQAGNPPLDCSTSTTNNAVTIRAGVDITSPVVAQFCLNELPSNVVVPSTVARINFLTVDSNQYGFLANFSVGKFLQTVLRQSNLSTLLHKYTVILILYVQEKRLCVLKMQA